MRKLMMSVALAAVVVFVVASVGSGPAWAQQIWGVIQCDSDPCYATGAHEVVFEQVGDGVTDDIYAQGGHDNLRAQIYTDDTDTLYGGYGHDLLHANDGDTLDGAIGGPGLDVCVVDATIEAADTCERVVVR